MVRNTPKKGAPSRTRRDRINKLLIGKAGKIRREVRNPPKELNPLRA